MFTIKLIRGSTVQVLSCAHYSTSSVGSSTEITLYKDFTTKGGVSYTISCEDVGRPSFSKAYIENVNGKTIDSINT